MTSEEKQYHKMIDTPVKKLVTSLAIPTIISMLTTAIYNIADTYFVANLAKEASGAVSVVFSYMAIIQAVGFTFGMGGGAVISSFLGKRDEESAQRVGSSAFYIAILLGILLGGFGLIFLNPLLNFLGAKGTILPYAKDYAIYIMIGAPFMASSFVMNNLLRSEGKAKFAMIGITTGGILNMGLDPLFIHGLSLGIKGAAIATMISQIISFSILLSMFLMKKSIIKLSFKMISKKFSTYLEIIKVGLPSFLRQGLASIATIILNNQAYKYGALDALHAGGYATTNLKALLEDPAIYEIYNNGGASAQSAMGIVNKIFMLIFSVCLGIGQGFQPVCGYNYFAQKYKRVKEAVFFTFILMTCVLTLVSAIFLIFSKQFMYLFIRDEEIAKIGAETLRFQCIAMPFIGVGTICNMSFQSMKRKVKATFLASLRQGLAFLPLIFILPMLFNLKGVEMTQASADILTTIIATPFLISIFRDLNNKIKIEEQNEEKILDVSI